MAIHVRPATLKDRARINDLDEGFPTEISGENIGSFPDPEFEFLLQVGPARGISVFVADEDENGEVVGFAAVHPRNVIGAEDTATKSSILSRVIVATSARRRGAGTALLDAVERSASRRGIAIMQAHIPADAASFYTSAGWTVEPPGRAIAWIEQPSLDMWTMLKDAGAAPGPRRAMTMLRTEDPTADADTGYDQLAYKVLSPEGLIEHFTFEFGGTPSTLFDALEVVARQCDADPQRFADLPVDVSRMLMDMVLPKVVGPARADQIRRARH